MKTQIFTAIVFVLFCLPTVLSGQTTDDIRITNLKEFRESAAPEPLGLRAAAVLSEDVKRNSEVEVWTAYVQARQDFALDNQIPMPESEGDIAPTFLEEIAARKVLADALKLKGRKVGKTHRAYSADLQKVIEAGFFKEHVFSAHHQPDWNAENHELRLDDYKTWAAENIPDHQPLSHASRIARASNRTRDVFIVLDSEYEIESESAFWLKYCIRRIDFRKDNGLFFDLLIGEEAIPTFKEELAARRSLVKSFEDVQDSLSELTRSSTAEMVKAEDAGFLREYVWRYLHQDGWEEPSELKLAEFDEWAKTNLNEHEAITRAMLVGR